MCCQEELCWDAGEICTHGHSRVGFRSRSGWGGRSWWWSPEAGNLFDSGRELCFQPAVNIEGPMTTFHPAMLHTCHLTTYFPVTQLLPLTLPLTSMPLFHFSAWLNFIYHLRLLTLCLSNMASPNPLSQSNALIGHIMLCCGGWNA